MEEELLGSSQVCHAGVHKQAGAQILARPEGSFTLPFLGPPQRLPSPVIGANLAQLPKQLAAPRSRKEGLASWKWQLSIEI